MELLDVTLTPLQRRNRAAFVRRADRPGSAPLVTGQRVVLCDEDGGFFAGCVVDRDDRDGDERYRVQVGVRLPPEHATRRLGRIVRPREAGDVDGVLDLLGEARDALAGGLPSQRGWR